MRIQWLMTRAIVAWFCFGIFFSPSQAATADASVVLVHVHGLAFSPTGDDLLIPSHIGVAVYRDGQWSKAAGPQHDYMGFAATSAGYYSSGHPAPGSGLVNPLGLMRSVDGRTWTKLGLEGQADFHLMAASYKANAVYVYNAAPNDRMPRPGLYSTLNDGLAWRRAEAAGLKGNILSLAVHPTDPNTIAVGTAAGLFISRDAGAHFSQQLANAQAPGVSFDHDGTTLWCSTYDKAAHLIRIDLKSGQRTERPLPTMGEDAVAYIAQHPRDADHFAIATFARSVFVSQDAGRSWKQIADRGRTLWGGASVPNTFGVTLALVLLCSGSAVAAGDAARGAAVFQQCAACHSIVPGQHMTGPSLASVWHRRAGTIEHFDRYSDALKRSDVVWNEATLDKWLTNPDAFIPGTTMTFAGLRDSQAREDVIAYLTALSEDKAPSSPSRNSGMAMNRQMGRTDLKAAPASARVTAITHCRDTYAVHTADGKVNKVWEFNLRFKTDGSQYGPDPGKPVIVGAGMQGDRASIVFAAPGEISSFVKDSCG